MIYLKQLKIFLLFFLFIFEHGFTQTQKDSLLIEAVKTDNLTEVKRLIKEGADVNIKDKYGNSLLFDACKYGKEEIVKTLIDNGINVNSIGYRKKNALHYIFYSKEWNDKYTRMLKLLLRNNVNTNHRNRDGETPIFNFIYSFEYQIYLANEEKNEKRYNQLKKGAQIILDLLVENGANIYSKYYSLQSSLLHLARTPELVELLIKSGIDINVTNRDGDTPLHLAVREGNLNKAKILLENGANPNLLNNPINNQGEPYGYHESAFSSALISNGKEMVDLIIKYDAKDLKGNPPDVKIIQLFLEHRAIGILEQIYTSDSPSKEDLILAEKIINHGGSIGWYIAFEMLEQSYMQINDTKIKLLELYVESMDEYSIQTLKRGFRRVIANYVSTRNSSLAPLIELFLQKGLNVDFTFSSYGDLGNSTALQSLVEQEINDYKNLDIIKLFVKYKAGLNYTSELNPFTPLQLAVLLDYEYSKEIGLIDLLLDSDSKITLPEKYTLESLISTEDDEKNSAKLAEFLLRNGLDLPEDTDSFIKFLIEFVSLDAYVSLEKNIAILGILDILLERGVEFDKQLLDSELDNKEEGIKFYRSWAYAQGEDFFSEEYVDSLKNGKIPLTYKRLLLDKAKQCFPLLAKEGYFHLLKYFVSQGINVNTIYDDDREEDTHKTALYYAVEEGHIEMVKYLLKKKANTDIQDSEGYAPLHIASIEGYTEIVKLLLKKKAKVNIQTNKGHTPLIIAVSNRHNEILKILLDKNANINLQTQTGVTASYFLVVKNNTKSLEFLLKRGSNPNIKDGNGYTNVHWACILSLLEPLKVLIKHGVDINSQNNYGDTPLHLAVEQQAHYLIRELVKAKPNLNIQNQDGLSPLMLAVVNQDYKAVKILAQLPLDRNIKDKAGNTLEDLLKYQGYQSLEDYLENYQNKARLQISIGHTRGVSSLLSLSNSAQLISGGFEGEIIFWDMLTQKPLQRLTQHPSTINALALSSDGKELVTVCACGNIRLWDLATQEVITRLSHDTYSEQIMSINFSPYGKYIVAGGNEGDIIIWESATGVVTKYLDLEHSEEVTHIDFSSDGKYFLSSDLKGNIIVWDSETFEKVQTLYQYYGLENAYFYQDKYIIGVDYTGVKFWDWQTGKQSFEKTIHVKDKNIWEGIIQGKLLFLGLGNGNIEVWNLETQKKLQTLQAHEQGIRSLTFTENTLISGSDDGSIKMWTQKNGLWQEKGQMTSIVGFDAFDNFSDGNKIIYNDNHSFLTQLDLQEFTIESFPAKPNMYGDLEINETTQEVFAANDDEKIRIWDWQTQKVIDSIEVRENIEYLDLYPQTELLAFAEQEDYYISLWDMKRKLKLNEIETELYISKIKFSPSGSHLAILIQEDNESQIQLWAIKDSTNFDKPLFQSEVFEDNTSWQDIQFLNDTTFVTATDKLKFWRLSNPQKPYKQITTKAYINSILFDESRKYVIVSENDDNKVRIREIQSGKLMHTLSTLEAPDKLFWGLNGKLIGVNYTGFIQIWGWETGAKIVNLIPKSGGTKDFILTTPDNYYFATKGAVNDLVHYVVGTQVYLFNQFDLQYNRPDIVLERIGLAPKELIATYRLAYIKRLERMGFSQERIKFFVEGNFDKDFNAPEVELVDKQGFVYEETDNPNYKIKFKATDKKYNLERIHLNIDGVPVFGAKGIDILANKRKEIEESLEATLHQGKNIITLYVVNEQGVASLEQRMEIVYNPPTEKLSKPNLYVLAVGVNQYQDANIKPLEYAVKDAEKVAEVFGGSSAQFGKIKTITLLDEQVNRESILALRKELLKTNPEDMVVFSFSGHGFLDDEQNYYLATYNTDLDKLAETGLKYDMVESLLDSIPARQKLMLIDACHSGEVDKASLRLKKGEKVEERVESRRRTKNDGSTYEVNVLSQNAFEVMKASFSDLRIGTGTTVISASGGLEVATEDNAWGHGAFTYALIQGLGQDKKADLDQDGVVKLSELKKYLSEEVERLTEGFQKPTSRIENIANDFIVRK